MTRIQSLFEQKQEKILSIYCTAGFPQLDSTLKVMQALQENGADLIELGMPYSDPLADGPVIQESNTIALHNGMHLSLLFDQLRDMRKDIHIPVILMGYMNPVMQYGFEKFCSDAAAVGVDGLILPDLPDHAFETQYGAIMQRYGLDFIFLVTPETSEARIRKLDQLSSGFLYAVASSATTGNENNMSLVNAYLRRLSAMKLSNPLMVGFGISSGAHFAAVCEDVRGAIVGSAYIRTLLNNSDVSFATQQFMQQMRYV